MRGATNLLADNIKIGVFQLTRPLRGATAAGEITDADIRISTHTPLAGRDRSRSPPHYPGIKFQLTRPLRGATVRRAIAEARRAHFNSHAPCGARRNRRSSDAGLMLFQLTRPLRGATDFLRTEYLLRQISTHTPLAGRDEVRRLDLADGHDFNSHAPCGARLDYIFKSK